MSGNAQQYNGQATGRMWECLHYRPAPDYSGIPYAPDTRPPDYEGILRALDDGADPDARQFSTTILRPIALDKRVPFTVKAPVIRKLVEKGCYINAQNMGSEICSALAEAVWADLAEETTLLLELGADPNLGDYKGKTPLFHATIPEIIFALLKAGANVSAEDKKGKIIPLFWEANRTNILENLLKSSLAQDNVLHLLAMYKAHSVIFDKWKSEGYTISRQELTWRDYLQNPSRFGADLAAVFAAGQWQGREKEAIALWERLLEDMPPPLRERYADHVDLTPLRRNMRAAREDSAVARYLASQPSGNLREGPI